MDFDFLGMIVGMGDLLFGKTNKEKKEYHPEQIKPVKFQFRPRTLDEYIGQKNAKELVKLNIYKILTIKPTHILISGIKGGGKSSLAFVIANELKFKLHCYIGGSFTMKNLKEFLLANEKENPPHILMIDETHALSKEIGEYMYPILEDFTLPEGNNVKLRPFIFIGATTEKSTLIKKFAPLVDRIGCQIQLENYKPSEIKQILKQYNAQIYKKEIPEMVYDILSFNVRYTPRIALSYFDDYIVCEDIEKVLRIHRVVKNSLTDVDLLILKHLVEVGKAVGEQSLAVISNSTVEDYRTLIEPFLQIEGLLTRTSRGRIGTEKAKQLLQEIK